MALTLRSVKGYELTYAELDGNFTFITSSFLTTASFNATSGSFYTGSYTGSLTGDLIQTLTNIIPNGTASYNGFSNTTASLNYGINLITFATSQSYCIKLPQPVTGKSVIVVNKSGIDIKVFPSNIGGDINGNINGFAIVPPNGTSYAFNCYENPLPGGWSILSTNGTNQTLVSDAITSSVGPKLYPDVGWEAGKNKLTFINNDMQITGSTFASFPPQFNFLAPTFDPQYQVGGTFNNGFQTYQWISAKQIGRAHV